MKIYSSPNTGKTTYCKSHLDFLDGDNLLRDIICKKFKIKKKDINMDNFANFILDLFKTNRPLIESCYTEYMCILKSDPRNILFGTRRFMWLANKIYLETNISENRPMELVNSEIFSATKWGLKYTKLDGKFISEIL